VVAALLEFPLQRGERGPHGLVCLAVGLHRFAVCPDERFLRHAEPAAIRLVSRRPPSGGRPHRGRSASPAIPSPLNRVIQRRTVAGWHSSSSAGSSCSDSSTITARGLAPLAPQLRTQPLSFGIGTVGEHADRAHTDHDLAG
jgi:hypothetical protein